MWDIGKLLARWNPWTGDADRPMEKATVPEIGDWCREWRQGDVFQDGHTFVFDHVWTPRRVQTDSGAVVVSQSCDASLPNRRRIQIAPLVRIENPDDLREAASGARTQFAAVPQIGPDYFADLEGITTVDKSALKASKRVAGVESDEEVRQFAFTVARRFGRFAYPDEVVECFEPLTDVLKSKAHKEHSPLGQTVAHLHSIRVHCEDWNTTPHELTLIVILEPGIVPSDPDDIGQAPNDLKPPSNMNCKTQINTYAQYLSTSGRSQDERYYAWQYLAAVWAQQCEEAAAKKHYTEHVRTVTAELVSVDDFPLSRVLRTESLDLDYLSSSRRPTI